jgi:hypothetical protein
MVRLITLLTVFISTTAMAQTIFFDDFADSPSKRWEFITDQVMGGVSNGNITFMNENGANFARMTGNVSLENNGGFIQFRRKVTSHFDKSKQGLELKLRGNKQQYFVHIRTTGTVLPWQYYHAPFSSNSDWKIVRMPFSMFERSSSFLSKKFTAKNIRSIGIVAFGREHEVQLDVEKISIF